MRTLTILNWIVIGIYLLFALFIFLDSGRSGNDAAGRGMAMGFMFIGLIFVGVLIVLALIPVKWVRVTGLVLGILPLAYWGLTTINSSITHRAYMEQAEKNRYFQDPHLNSLMEALSKDNPDEVERLLAMDDSNINQVGVNNYRTLLGIAVQNSARPETPHKSEMVFHLLRHGADPNICHPTNEPPHAMYLSICPPNVFDSLLKAGADPNAVDQYSFSILYRLVEHGATKNYDKVKILLDHGADPNAPIGTENWCINFSTLSMAASHRMWKVCGLLIDQGADLNFHSPQGTDFWHYFHKAPNEDRHDGDSLEEYQKLAENPRVKAFVNN